jgi:hypothetical protein
MRPVEAEPVGAAHAVTVDVARHAERRVPEDAWKAREIGRLLRPFVASSQPDLADADQYLNPVLCDR